MKGSVSAPSKKPIPVSANQAPQDGHQTQLSPLGPTGTLQSHLHPSLNLMVPRWWWQLLAPSGRQVWGKGEGQSLPWGDADAQTRLDTQPAALQVSVVSQKDGNSET